MMTSELRVNGQRLWDSIMSMAQIGPGTQGGSHRLTLTDEDKKGRDLFSAWCEGEGCSITVDDMGNMFARRDGRNNDLPPIVAGSHLDTQPQGGKFDPRCINAISKAVTQLGYSHKKMTSGAGHDACQICRVAPTAMIFVPCAGGFSHNEKESAKPEDLEAGCNVLLQAMLEMTETVV